jgi:cyclic pyranopterin phosphate synthase
MDIERWFRFDDAERNLALLPLAARRVLDHLGLKLSLGAWQSLTLEDRQALIRLGSQTQVDHSAAKAILQKSSPKPDDCTKFEDPDASVVPAFLSNALGKERSLSQAIWGELHPIERWALCKVASGRSRERLDLAFTEIVQEPLGLSHLNAAGEAHMVSIGAKAATLRRALASSIVTMSEAAFRCLLAGDSAKGDVLGTARLAGIMAAKQTAQLIPLCHPLALSRVTITLAPNAVDCAVAITAEVEAMERTGVEMEALVAVSVAALTLYDMLKAVDKGIVIKQTRLLEKCGGKSGDFRA